MWLNRPASANLSAIVPGIVSRSRLAKLWQAVGHSLMRRLAYLALFCSGAAALIYEVTWTRLLGLVMGHTVAAATTVLAAFMGGLAVGAAIGGRWSGRVSDVRALRMYALLEGAIGFLALSLPWQISWLQPVLASTYANGDGGAVFALVRLLGVLAIVAVPAIAMGATLPIMVRWQMSSVADAGFATGKLYAANTAGAAVGAAVSGFVLLPAVGMTLTTWIGVSLNAAAALVALWLMRRPAIPAPSPTKRRQAQSSIPPPSASSWWAAVIAVAASGMSSLILQLVWTRVLAVAIGPTTYAFSAMVTIFIAGIALGSSVGAWIARRTRSVLAVAVTLLAAALATAWAGRAADGLPSRIGAIVSAPDATFVSVVWQQTLTITWILLPMTTAFGVLFPLAIAIGARHPHAVSTQVGRLYAVNSAAAVVGALATGLWLIPAWGLEISIRLAAALLVVAALAITTGASVRRRHQAAVIVIGAAVGVLLITAPRWDRAVLSSGAYKYAAYMPPEFREPLLGAGTLVYYKEGAAATVSVRRVAGTTSLAIDGKVDATDAGDMPTQKLLAHAPLLLHPKARRVGIIGLGSGVTLGSALTHPIERADVVEISPEVVEASAWFSRDNRDALKDPRTRLLIADGRTHLSLTTEQYDVLISEPSNPWMAGIAALFTREFFETARGRLAPGGVMCQWAQTYDISDADLRSIVGTFVSVFPRALLWLIGDGDILLLGSEEPFEPRLAAMRTPQSWPAAVATDLATIGATDPDVLLSFVAASGPPLGAYAGGAAIQIDDRLGLEFTGPRGIYGRTPFDHARVLRALAQSQPFIPRSPGGARGRAAMLLHAEAYEAAFDEFVRALEHNPADDVAAEGLLDTAVPAGKLPEAEALLERLHASHPDNAVVAVARSRLRGGRGDFTGAAEPLMRLRRPWPARVLNQLAAVAADSDDEKALAGHVNELVTQFPDSEPALYYQATLAMRRGQPDQALRSITRLGERDASSRRMNLLAIIYGTLGRPDDARAALRESMRLKPRDVVVYEALGALEMQTGNPDGARAAFAEALTLDPNSTSAREGLRAAMRALGR